MSNLSELETVIAPDPVDEEQLVAQSKNVLLFDDIYFAGLEAELVFEKEVPCHALKLTSRVTSSLKKTSKYLQEIVQPLMTVLSNAA